MSEWPEITDRERLERQIDEYREAVERLDFEAQAACRDLMRCKVRLVELEEQLEKLGGGDDSE